MEIKMTKEKIRALAVSCPSIEPDSLTLITPSAKYSIGGGRVTSSDPLSDYVAAVDEALNAIREDILTGVICNDYRLQIIHVAPKQPLGEVRKL